MPQRHHDASEKQETSLRAAPPLSLEEEGDKKETAETLPGADPPSPGEILEVEDELQWQSEATKILLLAYAR